MVLSKILHKFSDSFYSIIAIWCFIQKTLNLATEQQSFNNQTHKPMKNFIVLIAVLMVAGLLPLKAQQFPGVNDLGYPDVPIMYSLGMKNAITSTSNGDIWYSTAVIRSADPDTIFSKSHLVKHSAAGWEVFSPDSISELPVSIKTILGFGETLLIGSEDGLIFYEGDWNQLRRELETYTINAIYANAELFAVGTNYGLFVKEGEVWMQFTTTNSGLCNDTISSIELDEGNLLFIGTPAGLCVREASNWQAFNTENSEFEDNQILALKLDFAGNLWVGTQEAGLYKYRDGIIQSVYELSNFPVPYHQSVKSITRDEDGNIFTIYNKMVMQIREESFYILDIAPRQENIKMLYAKEKLYASEYLSLYEIDKSNVNYLSNINTLDINNVGVVFASTGRMAWDYNLFAPSYNQDIKPVFNIPKNSQKSTIFTATLWMGGFDQQDSLRFAGERFNQDGYDFWAGPVSGSNEGYDTDKIKWAKVWKISKAQIDYHRENWFKSDYIPDPVILSWPAHGNTDIGQMALIAPYMDMQANGIYEPLGGDYPVIRGDQALYFVCNDDKAAHTESEGGKLGIEIHGMAYAFNRPDSDALNHSVFVNYQIINRSDNQYKDFYMAKFVDFDLGSPYDDFVGCDTVLNSFFGYNGTTIDGNGEPWTYGEHPPAQAVTFLNKPLSSFVFYINCASGPNCDPDIYFEYYNYMRAMWKDSTHVQYGGNGHASGPGTTEVETNFMFSGDPVANTGWTDPSAGNPPGDRRGVGSVYIGDFAPNERICLDVAYVYGRDMEGNNLQSVAKMKESINEVQAFYDTQFGGDCIDLIPTDVAEYNTPTNRLQVFPNPSTGQFTVQLDGTEEFEVQVYNNMGQLLFAKTARADKLSINLSNYKDGLYVLKVITNNQILTRKILLSGNR